MNIRKTLSICLAAAVGFAAGVVVSHQTSVKAQVNTKVSYKGVSQFGGTDIPGAKIVGFSCVPHEQSNFPDCYAAYTQ
jgi:uncharacterized membrane protein